MHGRWGKAKAKTVAATETSQNAWTWIAAIVIAGYLIALYSTIFIPHAHGHDNHGAWSQEAQNNPRIQQWWRDQRVPGGPSKGGSCCNEADGVFAEAEIRGEKWFARFQIGTYQVDWMEVPEEVVITTPNMYGQAVVWYSVMYVNAQIHEVRIRCFIPGALT